MLHRPTFMLRLVAATTALSAMLCSQSLSGRVVGPTGAPISGVTVSPGHGSQTSTTDANGLFTVTGMQIRGYDVEYRPAPGVPWAGAMIPTNVTGAINVGDVTLLPGSPIGGVARNAAGTGLFGCNINVYAQDGARLFTPHDGTDLNGNFLVMVPAGSWDVRIVPPVGTLLVPRQFEDVTVPTQGSLGAVVLRDAFAVTGSVVDAVSGVPVGATRIRATDALTAQPIVLVNDTANTFGQFTLLLPYGIADLEFDPPVGNTHLGRQIFGTFVLGPTALGQVRLQNGVMLSGLVAGPSGAVAGADIDVFAADGNKVYTAHDLTDAAGGFAVPVVSGGAYRVRVEPRNGAGLVGWFGPSIPVAAATHLGTIQLAPGVPVSGTISGPLGPEVGADLDFIDGNGVEIVTSGDHTDAAGHYATFVPAGTWRIDVTSAEGSRGRPASATGVVVAGPTVWDQTLLEKQLVTAVTSYGIPTLSQGGLLPLNPLLHNLTPNLLPTLLDVLVVLPSGQELPLFPPLVLDVPPLPLQFNGVWLPLPQVPASATGKLLKCVVRFRDPGTNAVQDAASTEFVVL